MKTTILFTTLSMLSLPLMAEPPRNHGRENLEQARPGMPPPMQELIKSLDLTPEQKEKLHEFLKTHRPPERRNGPPPVAEFGKSGNKDHGDRAEKRLDGLSKKLDLCDEQKEKVRSILESSRGKFKEIRDSSATPEEKKRLFREAQKAVKKQIAAVLTPEQKAKLEEKHKEHHRKQK